MHYIIWPEILENLLRIPVTFAICNSLVAADLSSLQGMGPNYFHHPTPSIVAVVSGDDDDDDDDGMRLMWPKHVVVAMLVKSFTTFLLLLLPSWLWFTFALFFVFFLCICKMGRSNEKKGKQHEKSVEKPPEKTKICNWANWSQNFGAQRRMQVTYNSGLGGGVVLDWLYNGRGCWGGRGCSRAFGWR